MNPYALPGIQTIEDIAAEIWEIPRERLYKVTRERKVVDPRRVLIKYRREVLKLSTIEAAQPFGKSHSATCESIKEINKLNGVDKVFTAKYNDFITRANAITKQQPCK